MCLSIREVFMGRYTWVELTLRAVVWLKLEFLAVFSCPAMENVSSEGATHTSVYENVIDTVGSLNDLQNAVYHYHLAPKNTGDGERKYILLLRTREMK